MIRPTAQMVALTCYGNAFLQGTDVGKFFPENSTCDFCDSVTFVKRFFLIPLGKEVAKTPDEWFKFLRISNATGIRITWVPQDALLEHLTAGIVGGGGPWSIEVLLPKNRSEFWVSRWRVWNQDAPAKRIWRVTYGRISKRGTEKPKPDDLQSTATCLIQALKEIYSFSTRCGCGLFTQNFVDALDTLNSGGENLHGYHQDLAPAGHLSDQARAILDACQRAWVFGGMGSWNDMAINKYDQKEYKRVSEQLFQAMVYAISVAANDSYYRLENLPQASS